MLVMKEVPCVRVILSLQLKISSVLKKYGVKFQICINA